MGTWTVLANPPGFAASTMLLLTDGTVMVNEDSSRRWFRLSPDANGGYRNGTWSSLADSGVARLYYDSAVLADGRVLVMGGEYSDASGTFKQDWTGTGELYDPLTDSWSPTLAPPFASGAIGDAAACLLADGRLLSATSSAGLRPSTIRPRTRGRPRATRPHVERGQLGAAPGRVGAQRHDVHAAEGGALRPRQRHLGERRPDPGGLVDVPLKEFGPAVTLPDGRVFVVGGTGRTALYTAPRAGPAAGTWAAGPDVRDTDGTMMSAKDAPACLLPNGRVLILAGPAGPGGWSSASRFFEFDGTSVVRVADAAERRRGHLCRSAAPRALGRGALHRRLEHAGGLHARRRLRRRLEARHHLVPDRRPARPDLHPHRPAAQRPLAGSRATATTCSAPRTTLSSAPGTPPTGAVSYWRTANHSTMGIGPRHRGVHDLHRARDRSTRARTSSSPIANGIPSDAVTVTVDAGSGQASYLLLDRYIGGGAVLWAYVDGAWHGKDVLGQRHRRHRPGPLHRQPRRRLLVRRRAHHRPRLEEPLIPHRSAVPAGPHATTDLTDPTDPTDLTKEHIMPKPPSPEILAQLQEATSKRAAGCRLRRPAQAAPAAPPPQREAVRAHAGETAGRRSVRRRQRAVPAARPLRRRLLRHPVGLCERRVALVDDQRAR